MPAPYKYIRFFDKGGNSADLSYDEENSSWEGSIYVPRSSVGLAETSQFYLMEEQIVGPSGGTGATSGPELGKPVIHSGTGPSEIVAYWEDDIDTEFFLYDFDINEDEPELKRIEEAELPFDVDTGLTFSGATGTSGMKIVSSVVKEAVPVNVAFLPESEAQFTRTLIIEDRQVERTIATLHFYSESVGEDDRLSDLLQNMGGDISNADFEIFRRSDVRESEPDHRLLNEKRKELLENFREIFPFIGSYKALINIINFFGYNDIVNIKELWQNLDPESHMYLKEKMVSVDNVFLKDERTLDTAKKENLVGSRIWRKTSKFALVFQITEATGDFDENGIPDVEETFLFTPEEILIKMFALKNKLRDRFLPLNTRIVDVVGELLTFNLMEQRVWTDQCHIDEANVNIDTHVSVLPDKEGYVQDLRPLREHDCPVDKDMTVGGTGAVGASVGSYADCFLAYFDDWDIPLGELNDDPDAPIGYPVVLRNDTGSLDWNEAKVRWDDLENDMVWDTIGMSRFYEIEWKVSKEADGTPSFLFETGKVPMEDNQEVSVILPYAGTYRVEMYMYDLWNGVSSFIDDGGIVVRTKDPDFIGWYKYRQPELQWDTQRFSPEPTTVHQVEEDKQLIWNEYTSTWDLPLHPKEGFELYEVSFRSLDLIEFYQVEEEDLGNFPLMQVNAYRWENMERTARWEDLYHLWWDSFNTTITDFRIEGITGPSAHGLTGPVLAAYHENEVIGELYVVGSTSDLSSITDPDYRDVAKVIDTGDEKVYDGSDWVPTDVSVDHYQFQGATSSTRSSMIIACDELNEHVTGNDADHPILSRNIYYFNELVGPTGVAETPVIDGVSIDFDKEGRWKLRGFGVNVDKENTAQAYFGSVGDVPAHFEIYEIGATPSIELGDNDAYEIGATSISTLAEELNDEDDHGLDDLVFNPVKDALGDVIKVQGVSKFRNFLSMDIELSDVRGNRYMREITSNPVWNSIRPLKFTTTIRPLTQVHFTHDNAVMPGREQQVWRLTKEDDPDFLVTTENYYFVYTFVLRGSYSLELEVTDNQGNVSTINKTEIIKVEGVE